jgi:tripartite-type tricarboxylate transporter receptor subunit TctC
VEEPLRQKAPFWLCALLLAFALLSPGVRAHAQEANYPTRPIRWIVPWPAGGTTDVIARVVAQQVSEVIGQPIVIDNRGGASAMIGINAAVQAAPDGYTFLVSDSALSSVASLNGKLPFDPQKDLIPITIFVTVPHALVVRNDLPVKSIQELIALAKAKPKTLNFGSGGIASPLHLAGELFRARAGIEWTHIPYRGSGPAIAAVVSGEVDVVTPTLPSMIGQAKGGNMRVLAVMTAKRSPSLPDVPTLAEAGLPNAEAFAYFGLHAIKGTPQPIVERMYQACIKALNTPELRERLREQAADVVANTPAEYAAFVRDDTQKWRDIINAAGLSKEN